jgi:hypothetical protein
MVLLKIAGKRTCEEDNRGCGFRPRLWEHKKPEYESE